MCAIEMFTKKLFLTALLCVFSSIDCDEPVTIITAWTKRISKIEEKVQTDLLPSTHHAIALDVNAHTKQVFWSDGVLHKIFNVPGPSFLSDRVLVIKICKEAGTSFKDIASLDDVISTKTVAVENIGTVDGLAIDWIHDYLYWTDTGKNTIEVMNLDNNITTVIVNTNLDEPRALALHPAKGIMFWTDWGKIPKIERAALDGSDRHVLIDTGLGWPNGLTLDLNENKLYWVDGKTGHIESCNYDGSERKIIGPTLKQGFGISLFGSFLYYSDWSSKSVRKINKDAGEDDTIYTLEYTKNFFEKPMAVQVLHPDRQPLSDDIIDKCKLENPCSQLCINRYDKNVTCFCANGYELSSDGHTCKESGFLLTAWRDSIIQIDVRATSLIGSVIHTERNSIVGLDFQYSKGLIFWSNIDSEKIFQGELRNIQKNKVLVSDVGTVDGLAVDWVCNNLYWTDTLRNTIEVQSLDTGARKILYKDDLEEPRAIVIYPPQALMFFTDWGSTPKIESAALDGSVRHTLITKGVKWPNGLAIDWSSKRLYWIDGFLNTISSCNLDGSDESSFVFSTSRAQAFGIALNEYNIYYSDWTSNAIYKLEKQSLGSKKSTFSGLVDPMSIKIYNSTSQPQFKNPCAESNCSDICLPTIQGGSICACPSNQTLLSDYKTCVLDTTVNEIDEVEIRDFKFSAIGNTSATMTWQISAKRLVLYYIKYECLRMIRCLTNCDSNANFERYYFGNNITENEFKAGALYSVKVSYMGRLLHSDTFQTLDTNHKEPGFLKDVEILNSTSAIVYWRPVEDCVPVDYIYHLIETKDDSESAKGILNTTKISFNGLQPGTEYMIMIKTQINGVNSENSLNLTFTTSAATQEIQDLTVYKHTRKEIGLRWNMIKSVLNDTMSYKLNYKEPNSRDTKLDIHQTHCSSWPNMFCYTLQNLNPKKNYTIVIIPVFPTKLGVPVTITAMTKEAAPSAPINLTLSSMTLAGLTLKWEIPLSINGQLRSFLINIEEVDKFFEENCCQDFPVMEVPVTSETPYYETEIAGLQPASSYAISVSAKTVYFGPPQILTIHIKPPSMKVLKLPNITSNVVSWLPQEGPELWKDSQEYHPLIQGYMLLAVGIDANHTDTGIINSNINAEVVEVLGPNVFLVAQYFENGQYIDLTSKRDVECTWGEAKTSAFLRGHKYKLAAVQVAQYVDSWRLDMVLSDEFIPINHPHIV